jgi:ABC-type cobalt transport system substrate-binding protein
MKEIFETIWNTPQTEIEVVVQQTTIMLGAGIIITYSIICALLYKAWYERKHNKFK